VLDRPGLSAERLTPPELGTGVCDEFVLKLLRELVLLPGRVERREWVFPAPNDEHPAKYEHTDRGEKDPGKSSESAHPARVLLAI
jgi:hypothetical protein